MRPPRAPFLRAQDLAAGLTGAFVLLVVELTQLDGAGVWPNVIWPVTGLFAGLGLLISVGLSASAALAAFGRTPAKRGHSGWFARHRGLRPGRTDHL